MVKSKLDYLSKYTENPSSKKPKKKKKQKKRQISNWGDERLNDEDETLLPPPPPEDDDVDDDDERPVVVPSDGIPEISTSANALSSQERPRGSWNNVAHLSDAVDVRRSRRERHDSSDDDDDDNRPPIRPDITSDTQQKYSSIHQRREIPFSSDGEKDNVDNKRKRHDSDDEERPHKGSRRRNEDDYDYDSEIERRSMSQDNSGAVVRSESLRKQRHDSSDDEVLDSGAHLETEASINIVRQSRSRQRHDSSSDDGSDGNKGGRGKRARHDSDDSNKKEPDDVNNQSKKQTIGETSSSTEEKATHRQLMSSGHMGGLQRGREFSKAEQKIQAKRSEEALAMVDKDGVGETVYRDAEGRKVDAEELKKKKETPKISEEEQRQLNRGRVQKEQDEAKKREMAELQQSSFARHVDDAALDAMQKNIIREGDPMAQTVVVKRDNRQQLQQQNVRPVYKGPAPKPNRFGIRPGYRWDGVDRGNGFEDKLLASQFSAQIKREEAYKWSTADM